MCRSWLWSCQMHDMRSVTLSSAWGESKRGKRQQRGVSRVLQWKTRRKGDMRGKGQPHRVLTTSFIFADSLSVFLTLLAILQFVLVPLFALLSWFPLCFYVCSASCSCPLFPLPPPPVLSSSPHFQWQLDRWCQNPSETSVCECLHLSAVCYHWFMFAYACVLYTQPSVWSVFSCVHQYFWKRWNFC